MTLFEAYVTNAGKYADYGVDAGEILKFPTTTEEVQALLKRIGVDGVRYQEIFIDSFAAIIRKYVGITGLTPAIVNEFIKKIVVYAPEKIDGKRFQKVDIVFNFVGEIHFPTEPQTKDTEKQEKTA